MATSQNKVLPDLGAAAMPPLFLVPRMAAPREQRERPLERPFTIERRSGRRPLCSRLPGTIQIPYPPNILSVAGQGASAATSASALASPVSSAVPAGRARDACAPVTVPVQAVGRASPSPLVPPNTCVFGRKKSRGVAHRRRVRACPLPHHKGKAERCPYPSSYTPND